MTRIPPSQQLDQLVQELRNQQDGAELTGALFRAGARKTIQELLEAEVTEQLGRERYARRRSDGAGYRNGYKPRHLDTAEGRLEIALPQVRETAEPYQSALWSALQRRTEVLEQLVIELYVRGLSTRDIEDALTELGDDAAPPLLSRTSVSRVTEALWEEYEAFAERDLSEIDVVYLFADAIYESLRQQAGLREGILVTWAICADGSKVLVHLRVGNRERYDAWLEHLRDLVRRGLPTPLTVTTDGAPGLIQAVEAIWPEAERIRCWVHKMRNVLDKVPDAVRPTLKAWLEAIRDAPDYGQGRALAKQVIATFERDYPAAMRSLAEDLAASLAHLKLPPVHRRSIRTTNLIERSFVEERRRAKVLPRFRSERECLKLVFGVLWRASERWRRVRFTEHEHRQVEQYRARRATELRDKEATTAA
jgi:putative transposase